MLSAERSGGGQDPEVRAQGAVPEEAGCGSGEGVQADPTVRQGQAQHQQVARGPELRARAEGEDGQAIEAEAGES